MTLTLTQWSASLALCGYTLLPSSYAVPVDAWIRTPGGTVLHLRARGIRVTLEEYDASDLTGMLIRAECDCAEHRVAGAATRTALLPGSEPLAAVTHSGDGTWTGYDAGRLSLDAVVPIFEGLLDELAAAERRVA